MEDQVQAKTGYWVFATLTEAGLNIKAYEATYYNCGNCDLIHIGWFQDGMPNVTSLKPDKEGKAFIYDGSVDHLEARIFQMKLNEPKAVSLLRAEFAEMLEILSNSVSSLTIALLS